MDKEELIQFLRENLKVTVNVERDWTSSAIMTRVLLGDEMISEHEEYISPRDFQESMEW